MAGDAGEVTTAREYLMAASEVEDDAVKTMAAQFASDFQITLDV
jgi:hypothetical protein